jgi:hypothetical protein
MNSIISKVAASVLVAGIVISSVGAKSALVTDGNTTSEWYKDHNNKQFSIDIAEASEMANLTFIPNINAAPGSGFTLKFENGGYHYDQPSIFLCADKEGNASKESSNMIVVGNMFSRGQSGTIIGKAMTAPQFQFKNDANESLIKNGSHIYFRTDEDCSEEKIPKIIGVGSSCQTVTAQIINGVTTQGTAYPDYDTDMRILGKTVKSIKIACYAPVCYIDATQDLKKFTNQPKAAGINRYTDDVVPSGIIGNEATVATCAECDDAEKCITIIDINNSSTGTPIESLKFSANFYDVDGKISNDSLKLKSVEIMVDDTNKTAADYTIDGSDITLKSLSISGSSTIRLTLVPNEVDAIPRGKIKARIFDLDTNQSNSTIDVAYDEVKDLVRLEVAGETIFTVPYMNTNYKTFVQITTKSEDSPAKLSAVITDDKGKKVDVPLDDIPANGTVFLFSTFGPLYDAAQEAGLSNAWSVEFTTSAAAIVTSYMKSPNGGDRRVEAFGKE